MKHLKIFENQKNYYWIVDYCIIDDDSHSYHLFPDKESAEIYIIHIINEEREAIENLTDDKYFTEIDKALNWYEKTFKDIEITYDKILLEEKFEGSAKFIAMRSLRRNAKKYNL